MTKRPASQEQRPADDAEGSPSSEKKRPAESSQGADEKKYAVGFGRPPVHSRFTKGHRSRGGRAKGQRNARTVVRGYFEERITIREGDRVRKVTKLDAMLLTMVNKAVAGDDKAVGRVLTIIEAAEDVEASKRSGTRPRHPPQ